MSAYDNDLRVDRINEHHFVVTAPDDNYDVSAWMSEQHWLIDPARNSHARREANIRNREEAEAFTARTVRGPFRSADEAIHSLIGDPQ
ncbi:hypothetical protein Ade02nite_20420 [Paractinoplanes deccanensis]|uniref:Uncharacterized protein n=1 Tax=Paractinoplanes deccanensis TaxID=113561 RepID=A0ABQ3Y078_9ACTN|nr:hypothetical protein [Actinoplanes deccanensis]GID73401.1 hypothetical protein Ade02nite_20420 [Actinoplanes deccanensis]